MVSLDDSPKASPSPSPSPSDLPMEIQDLVRDCSLFRSAPKSFVYALTTQLKPVTIRPHEFITVEGEEAKSMYWIVKGSVAITSRDGESLYAVVHSGQYFGEIGVLFDRPRTASVIARSKCVLLSLSSDILRTVLPDYPTIDKEIRIKAQERLHELTRLKEKARSLISPPASCTDENSTTALIESIPLLSLLPTTERLNLTKKVSKSVFDRFEYIFRQGEKEKSVYFVTDGLVEVIDEHSGGVRAMLSKGAMFGEFAFLGLSPCRTASIRTATKVECLVISAHILAGLCRKYVDLQTQIEEQATARQTRNHVHNFQSDADPMHPTTITGERQPSPDLIEEEISRSWYFQSPLSPGSKAPPPPPCPPITANNSRHRGIKRQASSSCFMSNITPYKHTKRPSIKSRRRTSLFNVGPFPDIIQIQIFQYMTLPMLMKLRLVCTHWADLLMKSTPLASHLNLAVVNNYINDQSIKSIVSFAGSRPNTVDISNCFHLTDEGFSYLINGLALSEVKTFKMKSVWNVSDQAIVDLTSPNIGMDLEEIDLSNCRRVNDSTVARLIGWVVPPGTVVGCPNLKRLTLSYCKHITDRCMYHMATYGADRIEYLDLTRCTGITDQGFAYWSQTMRPFSALKKLVLADCTFLTDKAMISLAGVCKELEDLNISFCCALSDVSVQVLSIGCTKIKRLNMSYCGSAVSDRSLNMIGLHLHQLEWLSIRGCIRVTRTGVDSVKTGCSKLKYIDTSQCRNVV